VTRILFVCQNDFGAPSEKQVLGFAQQLCGRGHQVMVMIGGELESAEREGARAVDGLTAHRYGFRFGRLRAEDVDAARAFEPALVHAWNSRTSTVAAAARIVKATGAPLFVHFEDDEWELPALGPEEPLKRRVGQLGRRVLSVVDPSIWWHSTWLSRMEVARGAVALDALTPELAREVDLRLRRPCEVVLPVTPRPLDGPALAEPPALDEGAPIVLITGTIWPVYLPDFLVGFRAVAELQRRGREVGLVHAGRILPRWSGEELAVSAGVRPGSSTWLGYLPYAAIPALLKRADVLLQPGPPSEFNRLRLPSKLQAYLESGTPTITFGVGFGELLEGRVEVLKTHTGEPEELADRIAELLDDPELQARLSAGGPAAAARLFDPVANTDALLRYYEAGIAAHGSRRT
jgi:glycosyltransferase involved in cell wall biosynthesis